MKPSRGPGAAMTLVPLALATFITALDNTVVNVALPRIRSGLGLSTAELEWVVTSYVLVFACLMLVGGRLADTLGRRRTLLIGLVLFGAGSTVGALASDATTLICGRGVQGVGSALILPATLAILGTDVPEHLRQLGVGIATATAAVALALGPVIGGVIAQSWHWSGIFLINLPVVVVTAWLALRAVPDVPGTGVRLRGFDLPGVVLSSTGLGTMTWALVEGNSRGWLDHAVLFNGGLAAVTLVAFAVVETRTAAPMVDPALFTDRVFSGSAAIQVLWGLGVNGVFFFTSLFLQDVVRFTPSRAGLMFVPLALALMLVVLVIDPIVRGLGVRVTVAAGLVLVAVGMFAASLVGTDRVVLALLPAMIVIGAGSGLTVPLTSVGLATLRPGLVGAGSSVITAGREVAGVLGVAVIGAVVLHDRDRLLAAGHSPTGAFLGGYRTGLDIATCVVFLGAALALCTLPAYRPARLPDSTASPQRPVSVPAHRP